MIYSRVTAEQKVLEFHKAMGLDIDSQPRSNLLQMRKKLLLEEVMEAVEAIDILSMEIERGKKGTRKQWANLLKELADVQYVLSGTFISFNTFPNSFDPAFNRVHDSNMSKLGDNGKPIYNEYGKVLKGKNYKEPKLESLISNGDEL